MSDIQDFLQPPAVPAPGVFSSYKNGWDKLWKYFLELFLIGIVTFVLSELFTVPYYALIYPALSSRESVDPSFQMIGMLIVFEVLSLIYSILFLTPLSYGVSFAYLKAARGEKPEVKDMFGGFRNYWNCVLSYLLVIAIVLIGLILLIIPGIVFSYKLSFVPYLVIDRKMTPVDAVKESWRMTGGYTWNIFFIGLLAIPVFIAGLLALIVGLIPAYMWVMLALASMYHAVSRKSLVKFPHPDSSTSLRSVSE